MKKNYILIQIILIFAFVIGLKLIPNLNTKSVDFEFISKLEQTISSKPDLKGSFTKVECLSLKDNQTIFKDQLSIHDQAQLTNICEGRVTNHIWSKDSNYPFLYSEKLSLESDLVVFINSCIKYNLFNRALLAVKNSSIPISSHGISLEGLIYAKQAAVVKTSSQKVLKVNQAIEKLNLAVQLSPCDLFVRKTRYEVMSQIPKFFQNSDSLKSDREFLAGVKI